MFSCTVDSISIVASIAGTVEASLRVSALCILMTVVHVITLTFVNVCITKEIASHSFVELQLCHFVTIGSKFIHVPLQFNPFSYSWYPVSQLQMKLPIVLIQLCSQPPFAVLHSLMSTDIHSSKH